MRILLMVLAALSLLVGLGSCVIAKNVMSEIGAYLWLAMFAVYFVGIVLLEALHDIKTELARDRVPELRELVDTPPPRA